MNQAEIVELAQRFHDEYERNSPHFGYTTREDTRAFDITSPNGQLMIAVVQTIMVPAIRAAYAQGREDAAKVCDDELTVGSLLAAAIRRGE